MSTPDTITAPSVKDIVQFEVPAILRRQHLNRDVVIGLIGDRGDGKSLGGGIIAICDYLVQNEPCFSNLAISAAFNISEAIAAKYGVQGGVAEFHSQELDMPKFLRFASEYKGGVFYIDEINVALADARRSMSNQNIEATDVGQQLRKLQSALIYTSIHEMFVESRIRDMTDIFIKTMDTALTPQGLVAKKKPGLEFEWALYPMSRKLTGERYQDTKQVLKATIKGHRWWGAIDTLQRQDRKKYKVPIGETGEADMEMTLTESPAMVAAKSKWGWLYDAIKVLHDEGYTEIHSKELWEYLQLRERGISSGVVGDQLPYMGVRIIRRAPRQMGGQIYGIDTFDLEHNIYSDKGDKEKEAVLVR